MSQTTGAHSDLPRRPVFEPLEERVLLCACHVFSGCTHIDNFGRVASVHAMPEVSAAGQVAQGGSAQSPAAQASAALAPEAPLDVSQTFKLHSNPGATKVIYLDFDGHTTSGTWWNTSFNGGQSFTTPAYNFRGASSSFAPAELKRIQRIWERVAEDYRPFDVDVTTEDPGVEALRWGSGSDQRWGIRVVIGGNARDWFGYGAGGVAYLYTFTSSVDIPAFVFAENLANRAKYVAEAITHEVGHTLGLDHDGTYWSEYYTGHGSGINGWAPVMGVGYYKPLVQWSKGEYPYADEQEDDLAVITGWNGFGYRADDHGSALHTADSLSVFGGTIVASEGIIERNTDRDFFGFTVSDGPVSLRIDPFHRSPNLDIMAMIYDEAGHLVKRSHMANHLHANFDLELQAGTYYLAVQGVGCRPNNGGYTDYGSLGYYSITGTIISAGEGGGGGGGGEAAGDAGASQAVGGPYLIALVRGASTSLADGVDYSVHSDSYLAEGAQTESPLGQFIPETPVPLGSSLSPLAAAPALFGDETALAPAAYQPGGQDEQRRRSGRADRLSHGASQRRDLGEGVYEIVDSLQLVELDDPLAETPALAV